MTGSIFIYMGRNDQNGKYVFSLSLFVSFHDEVESKLASIEPKKHAVKKYTMESNVIALI